MNLTAGQDFVSACRDYFYLIDRNYPERGTLKIIGDRYRLSGDQRTVLYRGISSAEKSVYRKEKVVYLNRTVDKLIVDGYNVLLTIMNYRLGRTMFISTDGILRDAGSLRGRIRQEDILAECAGLLMGYIAGIKPVRVEFFLDSPVSHSESHASLIRAALKNYRLDGDCHVVRSADHELKSFKEGVIATSDTVIIEKSVLPVADLAHYTLKEAFKPAFFDLNDIIKTGEML